MVFSVFCGIAWFTKGDIFYHKYQILNHFLKNFLVRLTSFLMWIFIVIVLVFIGMPMLNQKEPHDIINVRNTLKLDENDLNMKEK